MTNWPPIFQRVSSWAECPKSASLEERAARMVCRTGLDRQIPLAWQLAEHFLSDLRAVAPPVEKDEELVAVREKHARPIAIRYGRAGCYLWAYYSNADARHLWKALGAALQESETHDE